MGSIRINNYGTQIGQFKNRVFLRRNFNPPFYLTNDIAYLNIAYKRVDDKLFVDF